MQIVRVQIDFCTDHSPKDPVSKNDNRKINIQATRERQSYVGFCFKRERERERDKRLTRMIFSLNKDSVRNNDLRNCLVESLFNKVKSGENVLTIIYSEIQ